MALLKRVARLVLAFIYYYSGLFHFHLKKKRKEKKLLVLGYHKVLESDVFQFPAMITSPRTFSGQLTFLKKHFQLISETEFYQILNGCIAYPDKVPCLVTFDDAWADTYENVYCKEKDLPFLTFAPIGLIEEKRVMWQEMLLYALDSVEDIHSIFRNLLKLEEGSGKVKLPSVVGALKKLPYTAIHQLLARYELWDEVCQGRPGASLLSVEEMIEMKRPGVGFGSHTINHVILTVEDLETIREEIVGSKLRIEQITGENVLSFCYPNGNYNSRIEQVVRDAGYKLAFATGHGFVSMDDNCFTLNRKLVHEGVSVGINRSFSESRFSFFLMWR